MADEIVFIARALGHPVRISFVRALWRRDHLSPSEFARESELPLGTVSYHANALLSVEVLEISDLIPRRGAMEHRYSLTGRRAGSVTAAIRFLDQVAVVVGEAPEQRGGIAGQAEASDRVSTATDVDRTTTGIVEIRDSIEWRLGEIAAEADGYRSALGMLGGPSEEEDEGEDPEVPAAPAPDDGPTEADRVPGAPSGEGSRRERLLALIEAEPGASVSLLAERLQLRETQVSTLVAKARTEHLIFRMGDGYAVTPWSS